MTGTAQPESQREDLRLIEIERLNEANAALARLTAIHNEKAKLSATTINTTALGLFGGGVVLPLVGLSYPLAAAPPPGQLTLLTMVVWTLVSGALHWWARTMLESLR
ncbi:hypothetical protein [Methylobacterium sp. CCH5-D2]|uniref:hypothetical protein n=1 Tax=Methylobacterium sp. CCH5-D2 TaxID=1768765 RepID=UPI000831DD65|nr:hypothetical protein [Methylobacterium sp. CCH5-D2]